MNTQYAQKQQFASDNYSGICPEALEYINRVNVDHHPSYGEDKWTEQACDLFREVFQADCEAFFVFNGTAANSLSLAAHCESYHSIICSDYSHLETDECGAPEFFSHGSKLLLSKSEDGKLNPVDVEKLITKRSDIHYPKPRIVSVTQATEFGTVYTEQELRNLNAIVTKHALKFHMDGARFANAVVSLDVSPRAITIDAGVYVLCLGGSKNGLSIGEAVIFFNREAANEFAYRCKQAGQLASKMRFIAAQWLGILQNDVWLRYAKHANSCAEILETEISQIPEVQILFPREANSIFVQMPAAVIDAMHRKGWKFYTFIGSGGARLMCSWDTEEEAIRLFIKDLKSSIIE